MSVNMEKHNIYNVLTMTTEATLNSSSNETSLNYDRTTIKAVHFYGMGIVIPIGLACNILALIVLGKSMILRRTVTSQYLMVLSIVDSMFLLGDLIRWMNNPITGLNFMHLDNAVCKLTYFLCYYGKFMLAWVTVAIAVQRFLLVAKALEVARITTLRRVRLVMGIIAFVSLLLNVFPLWTVGIIAYKTWAWELLCAYLAHHNYDVWNTVIHRVGSLLLPACIIMVLTGIIVYDLAKAGHKRCTSLCRRQDSSSSVTMERNLSAMLVSVALAFLFLRLPYTVIYYINEYKEEMWHHLDPGLSYRIYCAYKITDVVATLNHAVNFFLYCLCGSTFRKHLVNLFTRPNQSGLSRRKTATLSTSLKTSSIHNNGSIRFHTIKTFNRTNEGGEYHNVNNAV